MKFDISISFPSNYSHFNIFTTAISDVMMTDIGLTLLVPFQPRVTICNTYILYNWRNMSAILFKLGIAICFSQPEIRCEFIGPLLQVPPPQNVKIMINYYSLQKIGSWYLIFFKFEIATVLLVLDHVICQSWYRTHISIFSKNWHILINWHRLRVMHLPAKPTGLYFNGKT